MSVSAVSTLSQDKYYEDEVARNPFHLKAWTSYLHWKREAVPATRFFIYERALKYLPRSYKLWFAYLTERRKYLRTKSTNDRGYDTLINAFERAMVHMNKMPRIWKEYCEVMMLTKRGTSCRHVFDNALKSLPITQHAGIWTLYAAWAKDFGVKETIVRVFRRYLMFSPNKREEFVEYLESVGHFDEAALQLTHCINDEHFVSPSGYTKHQLWMRLCDICSMHPEEVASKFKVENIIRSGIAKFSDEVGRLWCKLADYYTRQGLFDKARDVYEEAIHSVATVKDFTIVFDAYMKVEEGLVSAKMRLMEEKEEGSGSDSDSDEDDDEDKEDLKNEVDMRLARIEHLLEKRPELLNSVVLRQNPHNVFEWHKRIKLFKSDPKRALMTYMEAIKTIDPTLAVGKLSGLWLSFARHYEKAGDTSSARTVFEKAINVEFKSVDECGSIWCGWGEMELRIGEYNRAIQVLQRAVSEPVLTVQKRKARASAQGKRVSDDTFEVTDSDAQSAGVSVVERVFKNVKVWSFYLDLEESLGTVETVKAAYDRVFELKVVTPAMVMNYASYLEEHNYFEDAFRVYEKGVSLFTYPQLKHIWMTYIDKFIARYRGNKIERLRDMFEQCLLTAPPEESIEVYIKYFKAEEQFGMARHALGVLDRATRAVPEARRLDMYRLYARKVEAHYGVTRVRPVYERAIKELSDEQARAMCIEFADMERKLGEVDRARAILKHGSQFTDPRKDSAYWKYWKEFEEAHGNEDTFRDMLRIQRSIIAAYSQANYLAAEMVAGEALANTAPVGDMEALARQAQQEAAARAASQQGAGGGAADNDMKRKFVPSSMQQQQAAAAQAQTQPQEPAQKKRAAVNGNPDEIDIDAAMDDDAEGNLFREKPVPLAVFGSVGMQAN